MKRPLIATFAAASVLALAACNNTETAPVEDQTAMDAGTTADPAMTAPEATDTSGTGAMTGTATPATGDSVSISSDGMNAKITDENSEVNATLSKDPSLNVKTN